MRNRPRGLSDVAMFLLMVLAIVIVVAGFSFGESYYARQASAAAQSSAVKPSLTSTPGPSEAAPLLAASPASAVVAAASDMMPPPVLDEQSEMDTFDPRFDEFQAQEPSAEDLGLSQPRGDQRPTTMTSEDEYEGEELRRLARDNSGRFLGQWNGYFMFMWWRLNVTSDQRATLYAINQPGRYDAAYRWESAGDQLQLTSERDQSNAGQLFFPDPDNNALYFEDTKVVGGAWFFPRAFPNTHLGFPHAMYGRWVGYSGDWCYLDITPTGEAHVSFKSTDQHNVSYRWTRHSEGQKLLLTSQRADKDPRVVEYRVNELRDEYIFFDTGIMMVRSP